MKKPKPEQKVTVRNIVKTEVPFAGTFREYCVDFKGRAALPAQLRETLKLRQGRQNPIFFYRVANDEQGQRIELTDVIGDNRHPEYVLTGVDSVGRLRPSRDLSDVIIPGGKVDFVGRKTYIEVRKYEGSK